MSESEASYGEYRVGPEMRSLLMSAVELEDENSLAGKYLLRLCNYTGLLELVLEQIIHDVQGREYCSFCDVVLQARPHLPECLIQAAMEATGYRRT